MVSRVTLFGLHGQVDVIRRIATDDGAGGLSDTELEVTVYSEKLCRVTTIEPDDDMMKGFGFSSQQHRRAILPYLPQIQRDNDYLRIPFGMEPNLSTEFGIPDGAAPTYTLTYPSTTAELVWDGTDQWISGVSPSFQNTTGTTWVFTDTDNSLVVNVDVPVGVNPWTHAGLPWNNPSVSGYSIVANSPIDYRVIWHKHQFDDFSQAHHTSVVIELEDSDGGS